MEYKKVNIKVFILVIFICLYKISYCQTEKDTLLNRSEHKYLKDTLMFHGSQVIPKDSIKLIHSETILFKKRRDNNSKRFKDTEEYTKKKALPELKHEEKGIAKSLYTKGDTLLSENKTKLKEIKPAAKNHLKARLKSVQPHGSISIGYEYGVLPFVSGDNYPSGGFKSEGNVSFLLMRLPLELTYYYTNVKNVIGLNNYFRLSYDADRYKDQLSQNLSTKELGSKEQLGKLLSEQQKTAQNIEYLKFLNQNPDYKLPSADSLSKPNKSPSPFDSIEPTTDIPVNKSLPDTGVISGYSSHYTDSVKNSTGYLEKKDSIANEVARYQTKYDSISDAIYSVKQQLEQIKDLQNNATGINNPYLTKQQQFLSNIKKFEIGLCYPNYSTFLASNIPIQGINIEYSKNNNFLAFTYGTTINSLMNTNTLQGTIQNTRNLYNYFDFGNLSGGRKILSLKGGFGSKENTHLYGGFLLGKGKSNYLQTNSLEFNSVSSTTESNLVLELDARYRFSEQLSVDFVVGKSSVKEEDFSMEQIRKSVNEIFSGYRSYAMMTRINAGIKKSKTKLTFSTRWVDPFFKSYGIGFLRSDNLRFEIKAEQPITNKIKYTVAYRREEDNLLRLYNYKNTLQTLSNTLNFKITRQFNVRLIYAPLLRVLKSEQLTIRDKNHISTIILTYTPKLKKVNLQFNALYSRYLITGDSTNINFENATYTHQLSFKSGFKTGTNVSWFKNSLTDSLGNNTYLSVIDIGYISKKANSITIGYKMAYRKGLEPQSGFMLKAKFRIIKNLFWDAEIEKILIGDYYNSFATWKINNFPYYCSTRLVLNF
ncbi:MAG: hypothetical protein K0S26_23 [Bacteroidota bacterium]|jgi:hypothetical protein|nr:hypothetical protein [Bacteroidota bacterium]